ncbi:MAG: glycosyltransferase, partial [Deltaproteobacteria bacterium]|nr:glycosyltransferase [Deltaproteobacteria bacterium]
MENTNIYYWSPDYHSTVGGVKILYRHVDILNDNGFSASIIHKKAGFRCDWFDNTTRISYVRKITLRENDYLVIPEKYDSVYKNPKRRRKAFKTFSTLFDTPAKKIIFVQGPYSTFKGCSLDEDEIKSIYLDKSVVALMVVSDDSKNYLEYAFPGMQAARIHNSINQDIFSYQGEKKKQICFMPNKNPDDALQVISILKHRGRINDFTIVPIENRSELETAQIMKDSLFFLSFGYQEGFSLPPAEAMACGCIVVGY